MQLLKIIEKYPSIHHRELLRIMGKKQPMAKITAEKYLNELVQEKEIFSHKYGKEKQYFLSESNSTEKQLEEQFEIRLKRLKKKISEIETDYKKYDFVTKYDFISHLEQLHESLSRGLSGALRNADMERKATSLAYPRQIVTEIKQMLGKAKTKSDYEALHSAYAKLDRLRELMPEWANYVNELRICGVSQKRKNLQEKKKQAEEEESKLIFELEDIHNSLKSRKNS